MTDRLALILAGVILAAAALDLFANGGEVLLYLFRKIVDLSEYLIFWR